MPKPPEYPPQKGIGGAWEETSLEAEAVEPMSQGERLNKLNELLEEHKEMKTGDYPENELDQKREEIFKKWNELNKILPKGDKARQMIEKKMEELGL
jgi:hypothetical protein